MWLITEGDILDTRNCLNLEHRRIPHQTEPVPGMEKRDKLQDIRLVGPDGCAASVFAGKGIEECCQSFFKCYGVHVCSCVGHVSPTFSYRPERDKSKTDVKNGSDNIELFLLYGASSDVCQGGDSKARFREEGLSELVRVLWNTNSTEI